MNEDKCEDCPVEGFKVFKRITWGIISTIGALAVFGTTAIVNVNNKVNTENTENVETHAINDQRIKANEKAVEEITDTLKEQTKAFNEMEKALIRIAPNPQ